MKKYSKKLILDYISGCEIDNIDELENDNDFMIEVLKMTKDKSTYYYCSKDQKEDYEFNKKVIEIFKDDILFINEIANKFLDNLEDEEQKFELSIIMCELTKYADEDIKTPYYLMSEVYYNSDKIINEFCLDEYSSDIKEETGLGFVLFQEAYPNNQIILNYVAERMLFELFDGVINLEEILHKMFKSYQKFEDNNKYKILMDYVRNYDYFLANYIFINGHLLKKLNKLLNEIKNRWNWYVNNIKENENYICSEIMYHVNKYLVESVSFLNLEFILLKVAHEFNIYDQMKEYIDDKKEKEIESNENYIMNNDSFELEEDEKEIYESIPEDYNITKNIKDYKDYQNVKRIFSTILNESIDSLKENKKIRIIKK